MRAGLFLQSGIVGFEREEGLKRLSKLLPTSVALFRPDYSDDRDLLQLIHRINKIYKIDNGVKEPYIAIDQEGGNVVRLPWTNYSPGNYNLGNINNTAFTEFVGMSTGYDLFERGIKWNLAPALDILNTINPVMMERCFGEDTEIVATHGEAYIRGLQKMGVAATAKHFPGHGGVMEDSHQTLPRDRRSYTMIVNEAFPFKKAIEAGVSSIMLAHILYEELDMDFPASLSSKIQQILRRDLGFDGMLITDSVDMGALTKNYTFEEIIKYSLSGEVDLVECVDFNQTLEMADYVMKVDSEVLKKKLKHMENFLPNRQLNFRPPQQLMSAMSLISNRVIRKKTLDPSRKINIFFLDSRAESVASDRLSSKDDIMKQLRNDRLDVKAGSLNDLKKFNGKNEQIILIGRNEHLKDRQDLISAVSKENDAVYISMSIARDTGIVPKSAGYIAAYSVKPEAVVGAIYRAVGFI